MAIPKDQAGRLTDAERYSVDQAETRLDEWLDNAHKPESQAHFVPISVLNGWRGGATNPLFNTKMVRELVQRYTAAGWTVELVEGDSSHQEGLRFS